MHNREEKLLDMCVNFNMLDYMIDEQKSITFEAVEGLAYLSVGMMKLSGISSPHAFMGTMQGKCREIFF